MLRNIAMSRKNTDLLRDGSLAIPPSNDYRTLETEVYKCYSEKIPRAIIKWI